MMKRATAGSRNTIEERLEVGGVRVRATTPTTTTLPSWNHQQQPQPQQPPGHYHHNIYDNNDNDNDNDDDDDYDDNGSKGSNNSKEKRHHRGGLYGWWWLSLLLSNITKRQRNSNNNNNNIMMNGINNNIKTRWRLLLLIQKFRGCNEIMKMKMMILLLDRNNFRGGRKGGGVVDNRIGSSRSNAVVVIVCLLMIMMTIMCFTHTLKKPTTKNEFSLLLLNLVITVNNNNNNTSTNTIVPKPISKILSHDDDINDDEDEDDPSLSKNAAGSNNANNNINNDTSSLAKWYYYAYDDDYYRNPLQNFDDDEYVVITKRIVEGNNKRKIVVPKRVCRRTNWHRDLPIDCNKLHEFDIHQKFKDGSMYYLTTGGYREVYLTNITGYESSSESILNNNNNINNNNNNINNNNKVAFKSIMWDTPEFKYDVDEMRTDAVISSKISSSNNLNRIVDMYGYCGSSSINEAMMNGDLYDLAKSQTIIPPPRKQQKHDRSEKGGGNGGGDNNDDQNNRKPSVIVLSGKQKLQLALEMAESIAILHSYKGGVIVHDDLKLAQFMITKKIKKRQQSGNNNINNNNNKNDDDDDDDYDVEYGVKLNDFNRAEIMLFDTTKNEYCPYRNDRAAGTWRAPEEYQIKALDEKIDVYSLGSSYYALLTGHKPFENNMYKSTELTHREIKKKLRKGENDWIDPRYCNNNDTTTSSTYGDRKMCEIIKLCWEVDPTKRIDIFGVVKFLRDAIKYQKQEKQR